MNSKSTDFNRFGERHRFNKLFPWKTLATQL